MNPPRVSLIAAAVALSVVASGPPTAAVDPEAHVLTGLIDALWEERHEAAARPFFIANPARRASFFSLYALPGSVPEAFQVSELDVTDRTGDWTVRRSGTASRIAVDPQGHRVFVTARTLERTSLNLAIDAATGEVLWETVRPEGELTSLAVSPDGSRLYLSGSVAQDFLTVARESATGEELWSARWDGPGADRDDGFMMAVSPDGSTVVVAGRTFVPVEDGPSYSFVATVAYDARDGREIWHSLEPTGLAPGVLRVAVTGDGSAVLTRASDVTPAYDVRSGELLWATGWGHDLAVEGRRVFLTGGPADFATRALDVATGAELWSALYDGPASGWESAFHLALDPAGGTVAVSGESPGGGTRREFATVAYATASGAQLWVARYHVAGDHNFDARPPIFATFSADGAHLIVYGDTRESESTGIRSGFAVAYAVGLAVGVDVRPEARSEAIHPSSRGMLQVALLGSERFDVATVDLSSLRLGAGGAESIGEAHAPAGRQSRPLDVNGDGYADRLLRFRASETGIACGDRSVTLTGTTLAGRRLEGSDSISTVGCSSVIEPTRVEVLTAR